MNVVTNSANNLVEVTKGMIECFSFNFYVNWIGLLVIDYDMSKHHYVVTYYDQRPHNGEYKTGIRTRVIDDKVDDIIKLMDCEEDGYVRTLVNILIDCHKELRKILKLTLEEYLPLDLAQICYQYFDPTDYMPTIKDYDDQYNGCEIAFCYHYETDQIHWDRVRTFNNDAKKRKELFRESSEYYYDSKEKGTWDDLNDDINDYD